jgi:hypothetical protein
MRFKLSITTAQLSDAVFDEIQRFAGIHCKSDRNDARSKVLGRGGGQDGDKLHGSLQIGAGRGGGTG